MAKGSEVENPEGPGLVGYDPEQVANLQWETAHVEAGDQVKFDTVGDTLIGIYAGHEVIYPDPDNEPRKYFVQLNWTVPGGSVFTNAGYELEHAFTERTFDSEGRMSVTDKIPVGAMTRVVLMKLVDVDQVSEMKSFRVDTATVANAGNPE